MSQGAAKRLRRRFKVKFRDVARLGRSIFPKPLSVSKSRSRIARAIAMANISRKKKK